MGKQLKIKRAYNVEALKDLQTIPLAEGEPMLVKYNQLQKKGGALVVGTDSGNISIDSEIPNADWNATSGTSQILNKPTLITQTDIDNSIDAIEIGGTNLLPSTNQGVREWSKNTANGVVAFSEVLELGVKVVKATTTTVSTGHHVLLYNINRDLVKSNTMYTLSMDVLCEFSTTVDFRLAGSDASNLIVDFGGKTIEANTWSHIELTATTNSNTGTNQLLYIRGFNTVGAVTIANLKLEGGNKASDWSPAPRDSYVDGVWTPVFAGFSTPGVANYTIQKGTYTLIGGLCTVFLTINGAFTSTPYGRAFISGLPFAASKEIVWYSGSHLGNHIASDIVMYIPSSENTRIYFGKLLANGILDSVAFGVDLNNTDFHINCTITYKIA